jgi:hypothetical protein
MLIGIGSVASLLNGGTFYPANVIPIEEALRDLIEHGLAKEARR